jgi:transposase
MKKAKTALTRNCTQSSTAMYMAIELGLKTWKLAFSNGEKDRMVNVKGGDLKALLKAIDKAKQRFRLGNDVKLLSCYEAGRDGFWLHRFLTSKGVENRVVDSSSILVDRRKRRCKTDRIDAQSLLNLLIQYHHPVLPSKKRSFRVVHVPPVQAEDERRMSREIERLKKEECSHRNRIKSLMATMGLQVVSFVRLDDYLDVVRLWDGSEIPPNTLAELKREYARYKFLHQQLLDLERSQREMIKKGASPGFCSARQLVDIRGIGDRSSVMLSQEVFGWRKFDNRRQVGACAGLAPSPYNSGEKEWEQGISKAGNKRVRWLMIELSWCWLRLQPKSKLSQWYTERFRHGSKRMRRVGIVALARKLLIAFWRFLEHGEIPEGAVLKSER